MRNPIGSDALSVYTVQQIRNTGKKEMAGWIRAILSGRTELRPARVSAKRKTIRIFRIAFLLVEHNDRKSNSQAISMFFILTLYPKVSMAVAV